MILSVSRRTDIPAFYFEWFINRLREGYLYVKNPINANQVSRVALNEETIDCIVFWTKNPEQAIPKLDQLGPHMHYFQYTLNPYSNNVERKLPPLEQRIATFIKLSQTTGKERVIWRYDPIFLTTELDVAYHLDNFQLLSRWLAPYTNTVVISILDYYKKIKKNMEAISYREMTLKELSMLIPALRSIAEQHGLQMVSCAEEIDLTPFAIKPGRCIDPHLISKLLGQEIEIKKDKNQRSVCGCAESIEVGVYNTCLHGCRYCYANFSDAVVRENYQKHDVNSPLLIDTIGEKDRITERKMKKYRSSCRQLPLF